MKNLLTCMVIHLLFILNITGCNNHDEKPESETLRIISLAPHITEIIYALNAQNQLIAVTDFCNYPPEANLKEKIGGLLDPNIEKIAALKPTHLFGLPAHENLDRQLQTLGLHIKMMPNEKVADVLESIRLIGEEIHQSQAAKLLVNKMNATFDRLKGDMDRVNKIPGVILIGRSAGSLQNMTVAGKETYINEIWEMVGGRNLYEDLPARYSTINLESLLLRNPAVIIEFDMGRDRAVVKSDLGAEWELLNDTRAVKNRQVYIIRGNHTMIPGPRMTWLAEDFKKIIHDVENNE